MPTEYHFEESWFGFYLVTGLALALWVIGVARWRDTSRHSRRGQEDNNGIPERTDTDIRVVRWLGGVAISAGVLATLVIFFDQGAPYLTRFDTEGVTYLSAICWKREMWKDASKIILVPGKNLFVRVYFPYYALDFNAQRFVHPEQVMRTLRAEIERHKKPAQVE